MNLAQEAYERLGGQGSYTFSIRYSGRFKDYNAYVTKSGRDITFSVSKKWEHISEEIVIGLLQDLLIRLLSFKTKKTFNTDLYDSFIRSLQKTNVNAVAEPVLKESFERLNERFFSGLLDMPNMTWGRDSHRKLASYDHHSDTITVSTLFKAASQEMLDYLVYHELLHKKLQYRSSGGRTHHHGAEFRKRERLYPRAEQLERETGEFLKGKKRRFLTQWL